MVESNTMERCVHDMVAEWCAICRHLTIDVTPDGAGEAIKVLTFPMKCHNCKYPLQPGDEIVRFMNHSRQKLQWKGVECCADD